LLLQVEYPTHCGVKRLHPVFVHKRLICLFSSRPVSLDIGTYLRFLCPAGPKRQVSDRLDLDELNYHHCDTHRTHSTHINTLLSTYSDFSNLNSNFSSFVSVDK
jgi:hypothetical protein